MPKASTSKNEGERLVGWNFKHYASDSAKMNVINLPMAESAVHRKMTSDRDVTQGDAPNAPTKSKGAKRQSKLPDEIASQLQDLGVQSKRARAEADASEPTQTKDGAPSAVPEPDNDAAMEEASDVEKLMSAGAGGDIEMTTASKKRGSMTSSYAAVSHSK